MEKLHKYRVRKDITGNKLYNEARCEYLQLLEKQEVYWQQRAKQIWLREGDQNSHFFHQYAFIRNKNNSLNIIKNKDGV